MDKKISLVSAKNRGISLDMLVLKDYIANNVDNVEFCSLTVNENAKNRLVKKGNTDLRKKYCANYGDMICVDGSIAGKMPKDAPEGNKVLIEAPYDYVFKALNEHDKGMTKKKNTYKNFTHIVPGSPFGLEALKKCYNIKNAEIIDGISIPYGWKIHDEERKNELYNKFINYYPYMENKKVVAVLLAGTLEDEKDNPYTEIDWKNIFEKIDDERIILTNDTYLLDNMTHIGFEYRERIIFTNRTFDAREILYFADCLITNSGLYAGYFASKRKPLYCLRYTDSQFEKFIKRRYPKLYFGKVEEIAQYDNLLEYTDEKAKLCEYLSYGNGDNPCVKTAEIFGK